MYTQLYVTQEDQLDPVRQKQIHYCT